MKKLFISLFFLLIAGLWAHSQTIIQVTAQLRLRKVSATNWVFEYDSTGGKNWIRIVSQGMIVKLSKNSYIKITKKSLYDSIGWMENDSTLHLKAERMIPSRGVTINKVITDSTIDYTFVVAPVVAITTSSSTPTPDATTQDIYTLSALAVNPTFAAPSGSPVDGQSLLIRIKDNGSARTLQWNSIYRGSAGLPLPSTTTAGKWMYVQFIYNLADTRFDLVGLTDGI